MDEALLAGPLCSDQCLWTAEEEAKHGSQSKAGSKSETLSLRGFWVFYPQWQCEIIGTGYKNCYTDSPAHYPALLDLIPLKGGGIPHQ